LFSTHPRTGERVHILRSMVGGADYRQYEKGYRKLHGGVGLLGENTLAAEKGVGIRPASVETEPPLAQRRREALDAAYRASGWRFAQCACGMRTKVPPAYRPTTLDCPSCGKAVSLAPARQFAASAESASGGQPLRVSLEPSRTWRTIECPCGAAIEVSPEFSARRIRCGQCGRRIEVDMQP